MALLRHRCPVFYTMHKAKKVKLAFLFKAAMNFKSNILLTEHLEKHFSILKVLLHLYIPQYANIFEKKKNNFDIIPRPNVKVNIFLIHDFVNFYNSLHKFE